MTVLFRKKALLLKILFSAGVFSILTLRVDYSALKGMVQNIHLHSCLLAVFFILCQIMALSLRWMLLINAGEKRMGFLTSVRITLVSFLANYIFITSAGGIVARVVLSINHGFSLVRSLTATFLDRAMTLLALCLLAAVFIPVARPLFDAHLFTVTTLMILLTLGCMIGLGLFFAYKNRRSIIFSSRKMAVFYKYLRELVTDQNLLARITVLSLVAQVMYFCAVYVILRSLGGEFSLLSFMAVIPIITFVSSLPIGYGGWGIREGAFIYGLGLIHMPVEAALMASVQIGLITMLTAIITGIPAFLNDETQFAIRNWKRRKKPEPSAHDPS